MSGIRGYTVKRIRAINPAWPAPTALAVSDVLIVATDTQGTRTAATRIDWIAAA